MVVHGDYNKNQSEEPIYIEFHPVGAYVKVSAIDAATGVEVSITGDASKSQQELEALAVQKLRWKLQQDAEKAKRQAASSSAKPSSKSKGLYV